MTYSAASSATPTKDSGSGRKAVLGAWIGLFVDMFDVYLPIIVLAPATAYFQPESLSEGTRSVITAMVFAATLLGRPIGALVFGHLSDRTGRKRTTVAAVVGFGATTLAIAALPGYESLGLTAVALLILLRFVDGIFLGGQYTSAIPSAFEQCPKAKRGLYGAFIMTGFPLAYCSIALITFVLLKVVPAGGPDAPYARWGWRIPFVIGGLLALGFALWYLRSVRESEAWKAAPKSRRSPLAELFQGPNLKSFLQVFTLMSGIWLSFNMVGAVLPGLLKSRTGLSDVQVTTSMITSYALLAGAYLVAGVIGQRYGRRPFLLAAGAAIATAVPAAYGVLVSGTALGYAWTLALVALVVVLTVSVFGVVTTYINERFHVGIRSSAYGLGYTTAVMIPSFYAFFQAGLAVWLPMHQTPLILLAVGGVLVCVGAWLGPETREADLTGGARQAAPAPSPGVRPAALGEN